VVGVYRGLGGYGSPKSGYGGQGDVGLWGEGGIRLQALSQDRARVVALHCAFDGPAVATGPISLRTLSHTPPHHTTTNTTPHHTTPHHTTPHDTTPHHTTPPPPHHTTPHHDTTPHQTTPNHTIDRGYGVMGIGGGVGVMGGRGLSRIRGLWEPKIWLWKLG
jgi:hypothetical protein